MGKDAFVGMIVLGLTWHSKPWLQVRGRGEIVQRLKVKEECY